MAGEWIKMRLDLADDPAVVSIAAKLDISEDEVVGKLHRIWGWADRHTTDGTAPGITAKWVNRYVSAGFAEAMQAVGWIAFTDDGIEFPGFDKHNGVSAKKRADDAVRQRLSRENRDKGVTGVTREAIPKSFRAHVFQRDGYRCVFCGTESSEALERSRKANLSVDHLIPTTRGGSTKIPNLATACRACNAEKNDRTPEEWGMLPGFLQPGVSYSQDTGMSHETCDKAVTREEKRREELRDSVSKDTGGKPPRMTDPKEIIFGYGLSLLVNAGTPEKQARSFLGGLDKAHGSEKLIDALRQCAKAKPLQPLEWLAAALPPLKKADRNTDKFPAWCKAAGFDSVWEAENAGCREHNAAQFHNGKRDEVSA